MYLDVLNPTLLTLSASLVPETILYSANLYGVRQVYIRKILMTGFYSSGKSKSFKD